MVSEYLPLKAAPFVHWLVGFVVLTLALLGVRKAKIQEDERFDALGIFLMAFGILYMLASSVFIFFFLFIWVMNL